MRSPSIRDSMAAAIDANVDDAAFDDAPFGDELGELPSELNEWCT